MPIRKFGTEPAKVETRVEDNDLETLNAVRKQADVRASHGSRVVERGESAGQVDQQE